MTIEANVTTISSLDPLLPARGDYISEGDDHLRLIKHTLQRTFPNSDSPLTSEFSELSKVTEYMDFKKDSTKAYNIVEFKEPTLLTNLLKGNADTDMASIGVVKDLMKNMLKNVVYPVGCYWTSESNANPSTVLQMPETRWERVTGFLAGIGTVPDANDGSVYNFVAGENGNPSIQLKADNLPKMTVDGSSFQVSSYTHSHNMSVHDTRVSIDDVHHLIHRTNEAENDRTLPMSSDTHTHSITGSATFGSDNPRTIKTVPNYRGIYIWRRTA